MFIDKVLALVKGQGNQVDIGGAFEKLFSSILDVRVQSATIEGATKEQAISAMGISEKDFDAFMAGDFAFVKFNDAILSFAYFLDNEEQRQVCYSVYDIFEFRVDLNKTENSYDLYIQSV